MEGKLIQKSSQSIQSSLRTPTHFQSLSESLLSKTVVPYLSLTIGQCTNQKLKRSSWRMSLLTIRCLPTMGKFLKVKRSCSNFTSAQFMLNRTMNTLILSSRTFPSKQCEIHLSHFSNLLKTRQQIKLAFRFQPMSALTLSSLACLSFTLVFEGKETAKKSVLTLHS